MPVFVWAFMIRGGARAPRPIFDVQREHPQETCVPVRVRLSLAGRLAEPGDKAWGVESAGDGCRLAHLEVQPHHVLTHPQERPVGG